MEAATSGTAVAWIGWPTSMLASPVVLTGMARFGSTRSTSTCTVRVSGSALGERRETTPRRVVFVATTWIDTGVCAGATSKSLSGTSNVMRTVVRSTTETMAVPGRTNAPGSTVRVATSPSKGARRTQSLTSSAVAASFACCDASCASSAALCAAFCSASLGDTKPPSSSVCTRADSCANAFWRASIARASAATARSDALALRQSSVASTSLRFTIAPGRTSTVSTYAEMNCGPTLASTHGRRVPTYLRVSRKVVSRAATTVTGLGAAERATLFTFDSAWRTRPAPSARTPASPARIDDRHAALLHRTHKPSAMARPNAARARARSNSPSASWISASVRTASASASSTALPMPARNRASAWS